MAANIELIAKIVQKNNGTFKLLDAANIDWSGFTFPSDLITSSNVYTVEQTEAKIAEAIAAAPHLKRVVVSALPETDEADTNTIYMVKREGTSDVIDAYDEYLLMEETDGSKRFEHIGSTVVDLSDYAKSEDVEAQIAAALLTAGTDAQSKADKALSDAKAYANSLAANYATAAQGELADTALQPADITEGTVNGAISVEGTPVSVHGLGTAAYKNEGDFDVAGAADQALVDAKSYTDGKIGSVDLSGIASNAAAIETLKSNLEETNTNVGKNASEIAAINDGTNGILAQSKDYTDELKNGAVADNTAAIEVLNGDSDTEGSVDKKIADVKAELEDKIVVAGGDVGDLAVKVTDNTNAIAKLNGDASTEGSVAKVVADSKALTDADIDAVEEIANKNKEDIAALQEEIGTKTDDTLTQAKAYTDELKNGAVASNTAAIAVLNGDSETEGSVAKQVADAVAGIVSGAPDAYNTLKEISDWIAKHPESVAELNASIAENTTLINNLRTLIGTLPEGETDVVSYIASAIAASEAKTTAAIGTAKSEAIAAAATDAQTKADAAKTAAIEAAATDAQTKADAAKTAAISEAESKINAAKEELQGSIDEVAGDLDTVEETLAATKAKADSAIQTVKVQGVALTPDENNAVDITSITADALTNGTNVLVLNGGGAI